MCSVFVSISIENATTGSDLPCAVVACAMLKSERRYRYRCSTYKPTPGARVTWREVSLNWAAKTQRISKVRRFKITPTNKKFRRYSYAKK